MLLARRAMTSSGARRRLRETGGCGGGGRVMTLTPALSEGSRAARRQLTETGGCCCCGSRGMAAVYQRLGKQTTKQRN